MLVARQTEVRKVRTRNVVPLTAPELKALRQLGTPE